LPQILKSHHLFKSFTTCITPEQCQNESCLVIKQQQQHTGSLDVFPIVRLHM